MRKRTLFLIIPVLVVLALLAGSSNSFAQGPTGGGAQAMASTAFTYQGQLKDSSGNPINNTCDFTFSAWDALSGGSQVGSNCNLTGVSVANGYFTVQLNAGGEFETFEGDATWLEVAVQCTGDAGYTTLAPRQELTATPYALSLRPGALVFGDGGLGVIDTRNGGNFLFPKIGIAGWSRDTTGVGYGVLGGTWSTSGAGVYGKTTETSGSGAGVYGTASSPDGFGVSGYNDDTTGNAVGVYGNGNIGVEGETSGWLGVYGKNTSTDTTNTHIGVAGETYGTDISGDKNIAVQGYAANPGGGIGVRGLTSGLGIAVEGQAMADSGYAYGVWGESYSTDGAGVWGKAAASSGAAYGVFGESFSSDGAGVYGEANIAVEGLSSGWLAMLGNNTSTDTTGTHIGVAGQTAGTDVDNRRSVGVQGYAMSTDGGGIGVRGLVQGTVGIGVLGESNATSGGQGPTGVEGIANTPWGTGVEGRIGGIQTNFAYGVWGVATTPGYAGYFDGDVHVNGTLSKSAGAFKIDDPLDPANKYLYHSFVESPDMKNIYDGVVTLDPDGTAWVQMPDWFQALNQDFRYQLTCIGGYAPVYVAQEIQGNRFQIGGGTPGLKVSWQVTGIRHDPYAEAHRIPVEQDKPANEQGTYLHPELYGQPASAGVNYDKLSNEPATAPGPASVPAVQPR